MLLLMSAACACWQVDSYMGSMVSRCACIMPIHTAIMCQNTPSHQHQPMHVSRLHSQLSQHNPTILPQPCTQCLPPLDHCLDIITPAASAAATQPPQLHAARCCECKPTAGQCPVVYHQHTTQQHRLSHNVCTLLVRMIARYCFCGWSICSRRFKQVTASCRTHACIHTYPQAISTGRQV